MTINENNVYLKNKIISSKFANYSKSDFETVLDSSIDFKEIKNEQKNVDLSLNSISKKYNLTSITTKEMLYFLSDIKKTGFLNTKEFDALSSIAIFKSAAEEHNSRTSGVPLNTGYNMFEEISLRYKISMPYAVTEKEKRRLEEYYSPTGHAINALKRLTTSYPNFLNQSQESKVYNNELYKNSNLSIFDEKLQINKNNDFFINMLNNYKL